MTPRQADLSKLKRLRTRLLFRYRHLNNQLVWTHDQAHKDQIAEHCRDLTWLLVELDDQLRELEYGIG